MVKVMMAKIIKVGSDIGIIIPNEVLDELGLTIGDKIEVVINSKGKSQQTKFMSEYEKFIDIYGQALKNLAER